MSALQNKGRKSGLQGLERVSADDSSQDLIVHRCTPSENKPFLGVIICGTGFSKGTCALLSAASKFCHTHKRKSPHLMSIIISNICVAAQPIWSLVLELLASIK